MNSGLFFITHSLSPLHAGTGQSLGKVDLPIEREKHTTYPCVFATGLKGALKKYCENNDLLDFSEIKVIFGDEDTTSGAGGAIFTDLKILLFPVRSSKGSFKWVTCDFVLQRFKRDYEIAKGENQALTNIDVPKASQVTAERFNPDQHILLEDYMFAYDVDQNNNEKFLGIDFLLKKDIINIDEVLFQYLVNNATQIIARNKLKENKTSENLWYEETLPAETVMYSFILPSVSNQQEIGNLQTALNDRIIQIGGNETVGYGLTQIMFL